MLSKEVQEHFQFYLTLAHNIAQIISWLFVFMWQMPEEDLLKVDTWRNITSWKINHYWDSST